MLLFVHMPIYDVVFTTNKDTGGPIKSIGRRHLATRDLNEEICTRISGFTPFPNNVVKTEVQLIISQHLDRDSYKWIFSEGK